MRALLLLTFLALFSLAATPETHSRQAGHDGFILRLRSAASIEGISRGLQSEGVTVREVIPQLQMLVVDRAPARRHDEIDYVEPNLIVHAIEPVNASLPRTPPALPLTYNDSDGLWGMKAINAPAAWKVTTGSKDVIVAVSDTGAWTHPDLEENFWANPGETGKDAQGRDKSKNGIDDDGNGFVDDARGYDFETSSPEPMDFNSHGTHVSGTIGAVGGNGMGVAGVAWKVSLMEVKFLGHDGSGTEAGAIKSILYAADNGARALNASWGTDEFSQGIYDAIEYAKDKGMLVVAAAGNDSEDDDSHPHFPSAQDNENLISVAAIGASKIPTLAGFSNWGAQTVDLAAPGENILSTYDPLVDPFHENFYDYLSGTSMAAPHVTGTLALMFAVNPRLDWLRAKDILLESVRKSPKLEGKVLTGGVLDAGEAVKRASQLRD